MLAFVAALGASRCALAAGIATEGAADMDQSARELLEGPTWVNGDPLKNCNRAAMRAGVGGYELYVSNIGWPFWISIGPGAEQTSTLITALKLSGNRLTIVFNDQSRSEWFVETRDRISREGSEVQKLSRCAGTRLSTGLSFPPGQ